MKKLLIFAIVTAVAIRLLPIGNNVESAKRAEAAKAPKRNKWLDMLEYAIGKHVAPGAYVQCRSKGLDGRTFIRCDYKTAGYYKTALFVQGGPGIYAVNGAARDPRLLRYSDIDAYPGHDIGISKVLARF